MIKRITYIFFLSTGLAFAQVSPSECFDGYPWSTNEVYQTAEKRYLITRQLFYSTIDRCHVAYHRTSRDLGSPIGTADCEEPWYSQQYKLGMGWPTVAISRAGQVRTNQTQLLMDVAKTNVVTSWTYWACHPQTGSDITNLTAIASSTKEMYEAMYLALAIACTSYVPASVIGNVDYWISSNKSPNLPTYCNLGAVLYDAGYTATNFVWNIERTNGYIKSCDWSFSTNSLPNTGVLSYLVPITNVNLYAADCLAACMAQLKYLSVHLVPGRAPPFVSGDESFINSWKASGTDTDGSRSISVVTAASTNYGRYIYSQAHPLAYAYLAQSSDYTWDDNLTNYIGTNATSSWTGLSQIEPSVQGWGKHSDWPSTGWECSWSGDMTINASITNNFPADPDYWHFTFTYGGTSVGDMETNHSLSTNQVFSLGGVSPLSWSDTWESKVANITGTNITPATTNLVDVTSVTNVWSVSSESHVDGALADLVWTNIPSENIENITYCIIGGVQYDFTNDFTTTGAYLKQGVDLVEWSYTNSSEAGVSTITNVVGQSTNITPGSTNIAWNNVLTNCNGDYSWTKVYSKNPVTADAYLPDAVGEINYLYHKPSTSDDPDITNVTCYLKYIDFNTAYSQFSTVFMNIPVISSHYADWASNTTHEVPSDLDIAASGHNLNYLNKVVCYDDYASGFLHLRITKDKQGTSTWYPYNDHEGDDARYFWCVSDGWAVLAYLFPKRNANLPMPK